MALSNMPTLYPMDMVVTVACVFGIIRETTSQVVICECVCVCGGGGGYTYCMHADVSYVCLCCRYDWSL